MAQVMPYPAATFHKLHLLLVDTDYTAVGIGMSVQTDNKTVGE